MMNTIDETQFRELVIKGEKLQAMKLVMDQTGMGLREAKDYVDEYCLHEKIGESYSGPSYSATNASGLPVYYKTENGEKHVISREEAPEFLVNKMEQIRNQGQKKSAQQDDSPNHKVGRRILICISVPPAILGIFFLCQMLISKTINFNNLGGAIACGMAVLSIYFIVLILWLDESIARRREKRAEEMEIPAAFIIRGSGAKWLSFLINLCMFITCAIVLCFSVVSFLEKNYMSGLLSFALFLFFAFCCQSDFANYIKNVRLSLHISGETIQIYRGNDEIATLSATTAICVLSSYLSYVGPEKGNKPFSKRRGSYPRAFFIHTDETLLAEIFLDLKEYHLLKKYLIQQGAEVTDLYNRY